MCLSELKTSSSLLESLDRFGNYLFWLFLILRYIGLRILNSLLRFVEIRELIDKGRF